MEIKVDTEWGEIKVSPNTPSYFIEHNKVFLLVYKNQEVEGGIREDWVLVDIVSNLPWCKNSLTIYKVADLKVVKPSINRVLFIKPSIVMTKDNTPNVLIRRVGKPEWELPLSKVGMAMIWIREVDPDWVGLMFDTLEEMYVFHPSIEPSGNLMPSDPLVEDVEGIKHFSSEPEFTQALSKEFFGESNGELIRSPHEVTEQQVNGFTFLSFYCLGNCWLGININLLFKFGVTASENGGELMKLEMKDGYVLYLKTSNYNLPFEARPFIVNSQAYKGLKIKLEEYMS